MKRIKEFEWKTASDPIIIPIEDFLEARGFCKEDIEEHGKEIAEQIINYANYELSDMWRTGWQANLNLK